MSEFESHEGLPREAEVLRARRESLERLRDSGIEPFAISYHVDTHSADLLAEFEGRLENEEESDRRASVAGRVVLARRHGRLTFLVIRDRTGDLQLFCDEATLGAGYGLLDEIDLGDIVGATGNAYRTRRAELSLKVDSLTMLTKALRPLPEKWHGLQDPDLQQRRRYLHLITDPTPRAYVSARATVLRTIRHELDSRGYTEVGTPVLQAVAGGALAKPFTTRHNALDTDLKLRISLELYLKRLLVGGLERIYEIGRNFRNEGIDREHNPEFTMLELYEAYGDYGTMMRIAEDLIRACARAVNGALAFTFRDRPLDLSSPFRRVTVLGAVSQATGEEVTLDRPDLAELADRHGVAVDLAWGAGKIVLEIFEKLAEHTFFDPTFVCDYPREVSPLARPHRTDPALTEHFDVIVGGIELGTAFSELTDPIEQRAKFEQQMAERLAGDDEAHPLDEDFMMALEHGMPPAGGIGIGIDRLLMVLTDAPSLRDLILFPHHRPESS
ncbi:MAG: lysine--tRNA ligase [Actinomycetota bacterium]